MFVCLSVCPKGINKNHVEGTCNNWLKQFYSFPFLYMTLAINKLNGHVLNNIACQEHLSKKTKVMRY